MAKKKAAQLVSKAEELEESQEDGAGGEGMGEGSRAGGGGRKYPVAVPLKWLLGEGVRM